MQFFIVSSLIVDLGNENKNWNNTVGKQKELLERIISKFKSIMNSCLNMKIFKTTSTKHGYIHSLQHNYQAFCSINREY